MFFGVTGRDSHLRPHFVRVFGGQGTGDPGIIMLMLLARTERRCVRAGANCLSAVAIATAERLPFMNVTRRSQYSPCTFDIRCPEIMFCSELPHLHPSLNQVPHIFYPSQDHASCQNNTLLLYLLSLSGRPGWRNYPYIALEAKGCFH